MVTLIVLICQEKNCVVLSSCLQGMSSMTAEIIMLMDAILRTRIVTFLLTICISVGILRYRNWVALATSVSCSTKSSQRSLSTSDSNWPLHS